MRYNRIVPSYLSLKTLEQEAFENKNAKNDGTSVVKQKTTLHMHFQGLLLSFYPFSSLRP
jgi:hypothetical protein